MKNIFRLAIVAFIVLILFAIFGPNITGFVSGLFKGASTSFNTGVNINSSSLQAHLVRGTQSDPSDGSNLSHLQVKVQGLKPKSQFYMAINEGSCDGPTLILVATLLMTDEDGESLQDFPLALSDPQGLAQRHLWLHVHQQSYAGPTVGCQPIDTSLLQ